MSWSHLDGGHKKRNKVSGLPSLDYMGVTILQKMFGLCHAQSVMPGCVSKFLEIYLFNAEGSTQILLLEASQNIFFQVVSNPQLIKCFFYVAQFLHFLLKVGFWPSTEGSVDKPSPKRPPQGVNQD